MENFELQKKEWTESDFEVMGWHDSPIYAFALRTCDPLNSEFLLDIDYIFQWIHPIPPEEIFSFWIAPATLVFRNIFHLVVNIDNGPSSIFELEIADIHRLEELPLMESKKYWKWHIELQNGDIFFESSGYQQIIKGKPVLTTSQSLPEELRGEPNFKRACF